MCGLDKQVIAWGPLTGWCWLVVLEAEHSLVTDTAVFNLTSNSLQLAVTVPVGENTHLGRRAQTDPVVAATSLRSSCSSVQNAIGATNGSAKISHTQAVPLAG